MKTKTLVKLLVAFSLLTIISIGIAIACGGWDDYGNSYSDFAPEPHVDASYLSLFYSTSEMFYGIGYNSDHITRFKDEILNDWKVYLKGKMDETNVSFLLFDEKSKDVVNNLYAYISKNTKNATYNEWSSKINLTNNEVKAFIEFLYFAKEVEKSAVVTFDPWEYENAKKPAPVAQEIINQLIKKHLSASDAFLKNRYWFQTIKAYFYSDSKGEIKQYIEKTKNDVPKNTLYYRALCYWAGVEYQSKDYAKANYLYSIVFDKYPALRTEVTYSFHPQSDNDWNNALALAATNDEKAALWALLGYYADEGRAINEIYKLNPKSPHLDFLLTRLINKTEQSISFGGIETIEKFRSESKEKVNKSNLTIVNTIAKAENTQKPYLWYMAAGYLQTMAGNYSEAATFLNKSEKQLPPGQLYKDQIRLLRLVNALSETTAMNAASENKLVGELNWLYNQLPKSAGDKLRYEKSIYWSKSYLSAIYKSQNNKVFEQLFSPRNNYYFDNENVEAMKAFLEKENKTPFEKLAADVYPIALASIYEYQAVLSTYENNIDQAYAYMQKAGSCKDQVLLANPFNGFIKDCHDCEHAAPQKTKYSKLRFIEIIQIMQNKVKNGEDLYNNYLLLGNSFYNMSYFGNARVFYEGQIIGSGFDALFGFNNHFQKMLCDMENAKFYYQKALQAATNNEQKAKCYYMLAKCERNEYYNSNGSVDGSGTGADFLAWDGFKQLKTKYSSTKYYKDVIAECGYFAKYAGK